ncbi:MAG: tetratricopeptide repeat protein [Patescibacteria group bacterium]|nr:tetratricopeptide repeat protein [Patescibacteria group bacterium]
MSRYKDYRDGYFRLAILEYQLNDNAKAQEYLDKVMKLDPNFEEGRKFEQFLNRN